MNKPRVCEVASDPNSRAAIKQQNRSDWDKSQDRLLSAAQKNDAAEIRRLVTEEGVNPSHANGIAQSAIHVASLWGNVESVEALISLSANTNAQNNITGGTPLHSTIQSAKQPSANRVSCAHLLITKGRADPLLSDFYGATPLDYLEKMIRDETAWENDEDEAKFCIGMREVLTGEAGGDLVKEEDPEVFGLVVAGDVDGLESYVRDSPFVKKVVEARDKTGFTPLLRAVEEVRAVCTRLRDPETAKQTWMAEEDLRRANEMARILALLLSHGASPDATPRLPADPSPLAQPAPSEPKAIEAPLYLVCAELLALEEDDAAGPAARLRPYLERIARNLYVDHKAVMSAPTVRILHEATRRGFVYIVRFFLAALGVSPDVAGKGGMTPLHFAARAGRVDLVRYLVEEAGADRGAVDARGKTALYLAEINKKEEVVAFLKGDGDGV